MSDVESMMMTVETVERQRKYVQDQAKRGVGMGVVFADAFLRGMRDLGYKNPAWAIAELIDNAFQAEAYRVLIRFGFTPNNKTHVKPDHVAIIDNGNGMIPEMIGYAVRWGGTDREDDRKGFGRYGYGLPSAAVSMARRYTVYSKIRGGDWHAVTVDIDKLAGAAGDIAKTAALLTSKPAKLPSWVINGEKELDDVKVANIESGTVIVLEEMDRLSRSPGWMKVETLRTKLLQHFGVIYRYWLPERRIIIDGKDTMVVDPLFLMEHGRFYDETEVHAIKVETRSFEMQNSKGKRGAVRLRGSVLPPNFQLENPSEYGKVGKPRLNNRFPIMREYNGLLVCRERRQIDTVVPEWTHFQVYDRNIKIEIDFDPELDEFFGITTSKQQIVIDDAMWEKLKHDGKGGGALIALVKTLRERFTELGNELKAKVANQEGGKEMPRPSEIAMEESSKFEGDSPSPSPTQVDEAKRNLEQKAKEIAEITGEPEEKVLKELAQDSSEQRWKVEFTALPEGPFYRPVRFGEQKRLVINTDHPFFAKVYNAAPDVRAALEVLLFVIAERELEVKGDSEVFYKAERQRWSERLRYALNALVDDNSMVDRASAVAEQLHIAEDTE
jgi:hypothetical protein